MSSNASEHQQKYINIARACLKALNEVARAGGDRETSIQAVYKAIDEAFRSELGTLEQHLALSLSTLERIASGELNPEQARKLAQDTLRATHTPETSGRAH